MNKKIKVLILGGTGMLGHKVYENFKPRYNTFVSMRNYKQYVKYNIFDETKIIKTFSAENDNTYESVLKNIMPDVVINCIGITKHQSIANAPVQMLTVNSLFPHKIALLCAKIGARFIHISTDCVFSGNKGNYKETDFADANDLYGRTKLLGEVTELNNSLTIRTSIIGRELKTSFGLLEWLLGQKGKQINGFKNVIFSGFTTKALSDIIIDIIEKHNDLSGLYHISSDPIKKYDLLKLIKEIFNLPINILPYDDFYCNRSLDSSKFIKKTGFKPLSWETMINNLLKENNQYKKWRAL